MASTYLTRTVTSPTSAYKATFSAWVKRSSIGVRQRIFSVINPSATASYSYIEFDVDDQLNITDYPNSSPYFYMSTNAKYRDTSAWYHIVLAFDTTQATASDRQKLYVNGEEITSFSGSGIGNQNQSLMLSISGKTFYVGQHGTAGMYFNGSMSHIHFIDGTAYDPTAFGEYDANGVWKIKTSPSVTYGNNGFFILKDGNSVTDQSGEGNNFTVGGGTLTNTEDNPSNVFCTINPLNHDFANADTDLYYGNTLVYPRANANYNYAVSTLGIPKSNGKFYVEAKYLQYDGVNAGVGIVDMDGVSEIFYENRNIMDDNIATNIGRVILSKAGNAIRPSATTNSYSSVWSNGDIISIAIDTENGAVYFGINGTWQNSGVPTSGSSKTGAVDISAQSWWTENSNWGIWCGDSAANHDRFAFNFGNGSFGNTSGYSATPTITSTAVASAGTNASGIGIFEHDVPTGYTALSTKGLNL